MIFYSTKNVYETTKERIRFIFDEFYGKRKIVVSFSGGKDSTVILHIVKEIMDERGIKTIPVFFCDQEVEAPQTIEYIRYIMNLNWVEPYWVQSFFQEWNASKGGWFNVWGIGEKWCREKEPKGTFTDVDYPVKQHFKAVLDSMQSYHFGQDYVAIGGVRIQESTTRRCGLTRGKCYKDITWGKTANTKGGLVLYPIWDWLLNDVWYYIFSNKIKYCSLYNYYITMKPLMKCRVSSFIHENSIQGLKEIREVSPEFYKAAYRRVENVNTTVQAYESLWKYASELPKYFESWTEYVNYLADHIIEQEKNRTKIKKGFVSACNSFYKRVNNEKKFMLEIESRLGKTCVQSIISEDFELSKMVNECFRLNMFIRDNYESNRTVD